MSVKIMAQVWENAPYEGGALLVLLALADWANDEGLSWPGMARLARKARLEPRQARRIIRQMEADKVLTVQRGGGRSNQNLYQINTDILTAFTVSASDDCTEKTRTSIAQTRTFEAQTRTFATETRSPMTSDPLVYPLEYPSVPPNPPQAGGISGSVQEASPRNERDPNVPRWKQPEYTDAEHDELLAHLRRQSASVGVAR
jgi:hypothetical protein